MRSLLNQGIHCVILTSGTLSPLHATVSELGIPIPVQLENPHIIEPSQVYLSSYLTQIFLQTLPVVDFLCICVCLSVFSLQI